MPPTRLTVVTPVALAAVGRSADGADDPTGPDLGALRDRSVVAARAVPGSWPMVGWLRQRLHRAPCGS